MKRDREEHARVLSDGFTSAWIVAEEREAVAQSDRRGHYIEFVGTASLPLQSLDSPSSGVRLLNVRHLDDEEDGNVLATVYVPKSKRTYFLDKFQAYATKNDGRSGRPRNENLVANIDDIRIALLNELWTDAPDLMPATSRKWIEAWLTTGDLGTIETFLVTLDRLNIPLHPRKGLLKFPERTVLLVEANEDDLVRMIDHLDDLAELRAAKETSSFFVDIENADQAEWVKDLLDRTEFEDSSGVVICILDGGVTQGHPLLSPILSVSDVQTVDAQWGTHDHTRHGHGTGMAGIAGYGCLKDALISRKTISVSHRLESVKILPPPPQFNKVDLWGEVTAQGIARAEIQAPLRKRIICMAITATETRAEGRPTSWSGAIDQLSSGAEDGTQRLLLLSGGNIDNSAEWLAYPDSNRTNSVHDPAQSWNALTVGAYTSSCEVDAQSWPDFSAIAPSGSLSPFSTTSYTWDQKKWPIKPDVVFEGGNAAKGPGGSSVDPDELQPLSTYKDPTVAHFTAFGRTSGATALAAHFAGALWAEYPELWPETVRALIVHSAEWSETMESQFKNGEGKGSYRQLLRTCGYGVPNISRATRCLTNRLTMIAQDEIRPFAKNESGNLVAGDLHLYRLPWPREALFELGATPVEMRVTLSYFIEPSPGERGWRERYSYASHGLRFALNSPNESEQGFRTRINQAVRDENFTGNEASGPTEHWQLGEQRDVGSVHSDIWTGMAAELAASNLIAVLPVTGWWKLRSHLGKWSKSARYALVVSIHSPVTSVDIYTPVANQITVPIEIEISSKTS